MQKRLNWNASGIIRIVCGFNGTITAINTTEALLKQFAAPQWENLAYLQETGRLTAREGLLRQISLLKASQEELTSFLQQIPLLKGFPSFAHYVQEQKLDLRVISSGLDYAIEQVLNQHNLPPLFTQANHLLINESGYRVSFPYARTTCQQSICKCSALDDHNLVILIGAGSSDCCCAHRANLVLAKRNSLLHDYCLAKKIAYLDFIDFYEVTDIIAYLRSDERIYYEELRRQFQRVTTNNAISGNIH